MWLTADLVEQLHRAHLRGKPVSEHVASLSSVTLAGIVEYQCLRRQFPSLPTLPPAIAQSALGRCLRDVSEHAAPNLSHDPQEVELTLVRGVDDLLGEPTGMLFTRITRAAKAAGFSDTTANLFQAAFDEMLANAVEHSDSPVPILAGYHVKPNVASFVVADVGRGVFESLRENPDHADVADHCQAIRRALHDGVSRFREERGNGFRPIFKAMMGNWGVLRFRSRKGCLTMNGTGLGVDQGVNHFPPELPGFQVAVTCRMNGTEPPFPVI